MPELGVIQRTVAETPWEPDRVGDYLELLAALGYDGLELSVGGLAGLDRAAVEAALDPAESVRARDSRGGPAPSATAAALGDAREALAADREALAARREALAAADDRLRREVERRV